MVEEKKSIYALWVLRRDGQHISIMEVSDYDKAFEEYKELTSRWTTCIKENTPFALMKPIVTTFDPGLIYEITITPVVDTPASRNDNPYAKEMRTRGLGNMQGMAIGETLDQGYR